MGKIKILQVNKLYYPVTGGVECVVQNIAEGLCNKTDMKVLVCQKKGKRVEEEVHGVPVCRARSHGILFSMPISFDFVKQLRNRAKDRDILHFHMPFPLGDMACLLSGFRGKVVVSWHSDIVKQKKLMMIYKPIMRCFLKRVDVIMVASKGLLNGSCYLKPYADKCRIIPLAIRQDIWEDGEAYLQRKNKEDVTGNRQRKTQFLFVGRLVYYKGCSVLLNALKQVPEGELTMVGHGELEAELKRLCAELNIEDRVHFTGQATDEQVKAYFRDTDVFVLPSIARSEAFGLVQLEAMAYGKPVINTNLPSGVPDVSLDGITGLTVAPEDADALAQAMNWMVEHQAEREAYGKAAKQRLDEVFTLEKILPQIYGVYEELLEK